MKSPIAPILLEPHLGELPGSSRRISRNDAATGASAAGVRALSAQMVAFYFRAPIKAFFRMRVDLPPSTTDEKHNQPIPSLRYLLFETGICKSCEPTCRRRQMVSAYNNPGIIAACCSDIWLALYPESSASTFDGKCRVLGALHEPVAQGVKRVWPPAPPSATFTAGFTAGTIQSIVAAPLDALQVRFQTSDMLEGQYRSMWHYGHHKLKQIGLRGVFAGWSLSFMRDSLGYAVFFSSFEYIKSQSYYSFVTWYYGSLQVDHVGRFSSSGPSDRGVPLIKPHYSLEPCFLMMAGVVASVAQQTIQHPLSRVQDLHLGRLEYLDHQASFVPSRQKMIRLYYHAYQETFKRCKRKAARAGGWRPWLFRGTCCSLTHMPIHPALDTIQYILVLVRPPVCVQHTNQIPLGITYCLQMSSNIRIGLSFFFFY
ncbi:Pc12g05110 [Penicillium rubens Wisconsin 54-1255]|uniref:Pc12g05110 protein n=1 Tax=Penicillium rubens (strain ATCC 28089 / DSM 1075 / NRRL 1951 / Wisconsin 54-1255) TaxID=500485 RepID=B6GYU5_PENRW|nr:Pc12g05110 [Penicillium rubens Wisconsin 54-1255]